MSNTQILFGADGGGTKTLGILAGADGASLARVQAGPSNPNLVGVDGAARTLSDLIVDCCREARGVQPNLEAITLGLAGAGSAAIRERLEVALRQEFQSRGIVCKDLAIVTDARIALEGAFGGGAGLIIIAGTGSILLGRTAKEPQKVVGGWGRILGDEGSGYDIGLHALKALTRDFDGIASAARLRSLFESRFGWRSREDLILAVYQENFAIPSLAPLVLEAAENRDPVSQAILSQAAARLAELVSVFVRDLEAGARLGVVFIGGLIEHDTAYARIVRETLLNRFPAIEISPAMHSPAEGAVLMGLHRIRGRS